MDWSLLHTLNDFLFHHDAVEDPVLFYVNASEALFVATLAIVSLAARGERHAGWRQATVAAVLSAAVALAIGQAIADIVDRVRPFVADPHQVHLFAAHAADSGFPSDHATASFAIAVAIFLRKRGWGTFALVAATALSVGRVAVGYHFPTDVLAGAALGTAAALLLWIPALRRRVDAFADLLGRPLDRLFAWGAKRFSLSAANSD
ncbi:MAG TPA: phosphatase PAP2 family protein [Solirubrobacterales bacterium]|nr:phosphatase PAP2 family protein [Solirubrobacterales bacterium]